MEGPIAGDICLRKIRRKRQRKLLKKLFEDYARNTTLHGLRYTTEHGLHMVEKIFWIITFLISVALAFYLISNVWYKWTTSPVIVSFAEKHVFVDEVPFPAVTICPAVKFLQSNFNYTKMRSDRQNSDNETFANVNAIDLICDSPSTTWSGQDSSAVNRILNLTVDVADVILMCKFGQKYCMKKFKRVLTDDGICFTFNALPAQDTLNYDTIQRQYNYSFSTEEARSWTLTEGYTDKDNYNAYPQRGQETGELPNMILTLKDLEFEKDKLCNALNTGYKLYLHHPAEWPQSSSYYFSALPGQISSMALEFIVVKSSSALESTSLKIRQCYVEGERSLKYFKIYSYDHCRMECLTNYTYQQCGCVWFHMPYNDSTKVCSPRRSGCVLNANYQFTANGSIHLRKCKCLPNCNQIIYDSEIHKSFYNIGDMINAWSSFTTGQDDYRKDLRYAIVEIFFKKPMYMAINRSELFGIADFLGTCGGLLGLFLGFSFLSIVEIFYFSTFRVFKTITNDLKNEKKERSAEAFQGVLQLSYNLNKKL